jgi:hypothetical protein
MEHQFKMPAISWCYTNYFRKSENFWKKRTGKDHGSDSEINYSSDRNGNPKYLLIFVRDSEGHLKEEEVMNHSEKFQASDNSHFSENTTGNAS